MDRSPGRAGYRERIRVAGVEGGSSRILDPDGGHARGPRWDAAGGRIAWIRDSRAGASVVVHDLARGSAEVIAGPCPEVAEIAWAPTGDRIAVVGRLDAARARGLAVEVRGLAYKRDGAGVSQDRAVLNIVTLDGGARMLFADPAAELERPRWSPDGRWIAVRARDPGGYRSRLLVANAIDGSTVGSVGSTSSDFPYYCWSPDGASLILAGAMERSFHPSIQQYDVERARLVTIVDEPPCFVVDDPIARADGRYLVHGRGRGRSGVWLLDPASGEMRLLALADGRTWGAAGDARGTKVAQVVETSTVPPRVGIFEPATAARRTISEPWPGGAPGPLAGAEPLSTQSGDGTMIDYWLLRPPAAAPRRRHPAVVIVHGGPHHDVGDEWGAATEQYLASLGFVVAWGNPRGSTSYGRAFVDAVRGDFGGAELRDLAAVVAAIKSRPDVDPARIGICGHSHGGFIAALACATTDAFRAAVCMAPIIDMVSEWGMSDEGRTWGELLIGGSPREAAARYRELSPSTHAWRTTAPTLLLHGERDERCPIGQSELLYAILRSAGVDAAFVRYPTAAHDLWTSPQLAQDVNERTGAWFVRTLAPEVA
ncbi:MAG TPA: alpha/beta fold hydrolase [Candidatus Limnocylindria bacterium]|nr:alpha/beta fold hydrolase [Candidatus Limnocylindria bacterium]